MSHGRPDFERYTIRGRPRQLLRVLILGLFRLLFRVRLVCIERVPKAGGVLMVANHLHNIDPALLNAAFPRPIHFMAKKEAFEVPVLPWLLRWAGAFPVDRGRADRTAIKRALAALEAGIAVGMFPEGTRSPVRALQKAHAGAGMIALAAGVPVIPVAITGSERLPFNGAKARAAAGLPWPERDHEGVRILFGEPFTIPREENGRRITSEEATARIMAAIARLLPPDYRGVYADAVRDDSLGGA